MTSWPRPQIQQQQNMPVTSAMLEDRINQYISAVDEATARNDSHQISQLQCDIQQLVDLMERVGRGQSVPQNVVPPPLVLAPQIDVLPNPHVLLSARLNNYHKALYFAEEELSENKFYKIQQLQRCLQIVNDLQERVQAGIPVRLDEVPPPVPIPSDDEFDNDAIKTLTDRISSYKMALVAAQQSHETDKRHIPKIQSTLRSLEFLMTRAKANRPVWKKDIPPEFNYQEISPAKSSKPKMSKAKFTLLIRSLVLRTAKLSFTSSEMDTKAKEHHSKLVGIECQLTNSGSTWQPDEALLKVLTKQTEALEQKSMEERQLSIQNVLESSVAIETKATEYENGVENSEREDVVNAGKQHQKSDVRTTAHLSSGATAHLSSGATAHLSPVTIKPAIETPEDKLAKKLSHYLEKGDEPKFDNLSQRAVNVNLNTSPSRSAGLLPKVLNSEITETTTHVGPHQAVLYFNGDSGTHFNELESGLTPGVDVLIEEKNATTEPSSSPASTAVETSPQVSSHEEERNGQEIRNRKEQETIKPLSPSPKSTDIYIRKTLDSVGFLACQNVLEHPHPNGKSSTDTKHIGPAFSSENGSLLSKVKSSEPSDLPSTVDVTQTPQQTLGANETSSVDVSLVNHVSSPATVSRSADGPYSLPVEATVCHFTSGPSSLPVTVQLGVTSASGPSSLPVKVQLSVTSGLSQRHHSPAGHISILADDQSDHQDNVTADVDTFHYPKENKMNGQEDFGVDDMDISELHSHHLASNSWNDSIEFQDLMESMSLPSLMPGSFNPDADQHVPVPWSNIHAASSNVDTTVVSDKPHLQNVMERTHTSEPRVKLSGEKLYTENNSMLSHGQAVGDVTGSLPSQSTIVVNSSNVPIISNKEVEGSYVTSSRPLEADVNISLSSQSNHTENSGSGGLTKSDIPTMTVMPDIREQVRDGHNSEHLSTYQRSSDRLATTNNLLNDSAFTCLENLKYHILIEEAKGTADGQREASLLRAKFDHLRQRLSNGRLPLWEEYRACVESELASLLHQIEEKRLVQRWTEVKILCEMKTIAERELVILRERLPELMY